MEICNDRRHGEVCFEGGMCPACEAIDELQKQIDELIEQIESRDK